MSKDYKNTEAEYKEYDSPFFAMMSRMKYINRWSLMRNSYPENISEHSLEVAMLAHVLTVISNKRLGNSYDEKKAAIIGMYHDCTEIITGDMPTPIKYYNRDTKEAYRNVEEDAAKDLLNMLPDYLYEEFAPLLLPTKEDEYLWKLVKAADRLSAYIKCVEEEKAGNKEFASAKASTYEKLTDMNLPEVRIFMQDFAEAYKKTLDELR